MNELSLIDERVDGRNLVETVAEKTTGYRSLFAPSFFRAYNSIMRGVGRERGGKRARPRRAS